MGRGFEPHGAHVVSLREIHKSGDYLTHEKIWAFSLTHADVSYRHAAHLFTTSRWRGFDWEDIRESSTTSRVLVIGHDDTLITNEVLEEIQRVHSYRAIFAANLSSDARGSEGVFDLPLGIPNDERHSRTHRIQADQSLVRRGWTAGSRRASGNPPRLYANFSVRTNPSERQAVLDIVRSIPEVTRGAFRLSRRGRLADLVGMASAKLVVCPRGHGLDTHRFWEALLVGAVPIVRHKDHCAILAKQLRLPHIALTEWSELRNLRFIVDEWEKIQNVAWDFSPLTTQYWKRAIIAQTTTGLKSPRLEPT